MPDEDLVHIYVLLSLSLLTDGGKFQVGKKIKDHKGKTVLRGDQDVKLETTRNGALTAAAKTPTTNISLEKKDIKEVLQFVWMRRFV